MVLGDTREEEAQCQGSPTLQAGEIPREMVENTDSRLPPPEV